MCQDSISICLTNEDDIHTVQNIRNVRFESDSYNEMTDAPNYKSSYSTENGHRNIRHHVKLVRVGYINF